MNPDALDSSLPGPSGAPAGGSDAVVVTPTGEEPCPILFKSEEAEPMHIDAMNRLRIVSCPDCGMVFALPMDVWLARMNAGAPIFCPSGHAIALHPKSESRDSLLLLQVEALAEIRQDKRDIDRLKNALARLPQLPVLPMTENEVLRRTKYVANRARRTGVGRPICRFCESHSATDTGLAKNLKRNHLQEIIDLPASFFD